MGNFVRIQLDARNKQFARGWLKDARERYENGKREKLSGVALHLHVIRVHVASDSKPQNDSYRSAVAYSVLVSGVGTYALADIANTTKLSFAEVRSAISYLAIRMAAAQPYFPYTLVYNKVDKTCTLSHCEGAKEERERLLAPRAKKAPLALPAPENVA